MSIVLTGHHTLIPAMTGNRKGRRNEAYDGRMDLPKVRPRECTMGFIVPVRDSTDENYLLEILFIKKFLL